ncbi:MAG: transposase [gamma proteobacterium symbiont of Taylorina sp.]|nr:transposase [gamma proteobacterium symbiont of Taylorina sp.]
MPLPYARKVEGDIKLAMALGDPVTTQTTLSVLIDDFLKQYNKKDTNINTRLAWWDSQYGPIPISQFNQIYVLEGIKTLLNKGTRGKPLQPNTTNRFKANLSAVFNFAKDNGYDIVNPCSGIKGKPEGQGRRRVFTEKEKHSFLEAAKKSDWPQFYLFILMGFTCGARAGELQKLTWKDIDFNKKQAFCSDTKNGDDKYGCRGCEQGVIIAPKPPQAIPRSITTASMLAYIIVSKFADSLPLYRQEAIFKRLKIVISRANMSNWMLKVSELLQPYYRRLQYHLRLEQMIQADETTLRVIHDGRDNCPKSYMWVYQSGAYITPHPIVLAKPFDT